MIYVSSSCIKTDSITDAIKRLVDLGIKNIELSGGTLPYVGLEKDLLNLKEKYDLNLLCHNYFPPPTKNFILNLSCLDDEINNLSVAHIKNAINLSKKIGAKKFAFHAGFLIDIPLNEIGKAITQQKLFDRDKALLRFNENIDEIIEHSDGIEIYIENNVLSKKNYSNFNGVNPFFLTDSSDFQDVLRGKVQPLLDIAHLKVSCQSIGLDLEEEFQKFAAQTDYIHVSDNNGETDSNGPLEKESKLYQLLKTINVSNKTITIEVYSGEGDVLRSIEILEDLSDGK